MIQLLQNEDGRLIIAGNKVFPSTIDRVDFFRDLKLLMLNFAGDEADSDLMPCEINDDVAKLIQNQPEIIILELKDKDTQPIGYVAPLVQIGL